MHIQNIPTIKRKELDRGFGSDLQIAPIPLNKICTCGLQIRNISTTKRKELDRGCGSDLQIACCQPLLERLLNPFLAVHLQLHLCSRICAQSSVPGYNAVYILYLRTVHLPVEISTSRRRH